MGTDERATVECPACGWRCLAGYTDKIQWLRAHGRLRRIAQPEPALVDELFPTLLDRLSCPACQHVGIRFGPPEDARQWPVRPSCERCGAVISRERLVAMPKARTCVACQNAVEAGHPDATAVDYCPRCGAPMQTAIERPARVTRYQLVCRTCGYRD